MIKKANDITLGNPSAFFKVRDIIWRGEKIASLSDSNYVLSQSEPFAINIDKNGRHTHYILHKNIIYRLSDIDLSKDDIMALIANFEDRRRKKIKSAKTSPAKEKTKKKTKSCLEENLDSFSQPQNNKYDHNLETNLLHDIESIFSREEKEIYIFPYFPEEIRRNINKRFSYLFNKEKILLFIDTSFFKNGKAGLIITQSRLYHIKQRVKTIFIRDINSLSIRNNFLVDSLLINGEEVGLCPHTKTFFRLISLLDVMKKTIKDSDIKNIYRQVDKILSSHNQTLIRKQKIMLTKDDYGNVFDGSWKKEKFYFIDNVILKKNLYIPRGLFENKKSVFREFMSKYIDEVLA